jgi:repressor LexA
MKTTNTKFDNKTELHQEWLGKLRDFFAEYRYIPTYEYMGLHFGIGAKSRVSKLVKLLKAEGFLEDGPDKNLMPGTRFFERNLSHTSVQAGVMTPAFAEGVDLVKIDDILVRKPSITELIPVKGDSMIEKGIFDGDTVIVEKRPLANIGDIVVAIIENKFTIKTLGKEKGQFVLIPANPDFETIRPKEPFYIFGVVTGLFRKF